MRCYSSKFSNYKFSKESKCPYCRQDGGKLIKRRGHSGIRHALISENEDNHLFLPAEVNSFHDCFISPQEIGEDLFPLAYDENGYIEAFNHRKNNILAIMWHPEREFPTSNEDYKTIKKFFKA